MKIFIAKLAIPAFLLITSAFLINTGFAQSKKQLKEAKKEVEVKSMIEAKSYVFTVEYVLPMRGGQRYVTPDYDLTVGKDTLVSYLPFFGRAYVAPINPDDAGFMFTATKFDYKTVENKNGWEISIKPTDAKDVLSMQLSVSKNGYATLHITSNNREAISYQGYVQVKKQKG